MKTSCLFISLLTVFASPLVVSGCSSEPHVFDRTAEPLAVGAETIHVVSHGRHSGIVIPAEAIQSQLPGLRQRFGNTPNIEFGWGDKGFYQAREITTGLTLQALFWPTPAVVHVVAVPAQVAGYFPESQVEKLFLGAQEYSSLVSFVSRSFHKNREGKIEELESGIYGESQFYQAVGDFYLFNTCNKWTAKGLKSAGIDISTAFKLTADSVMKSVTSYKQTLKSESAGTSN